QAEVPPLVVDANQELLAVMLHLVLAALHPWRNRLPLARWRACIQIAPLRCGVAADLQQQVLAASRALHAYVEALVFLLVDQVIRLGRAQDVPVEPVLTLGRILNRVEDSLVVRRPGN